MVSAVNKAFKRRHHRQMVLCLDDSKAQHRHRNWYLDLDDGFKWRVAPTWLPASLQVIGALVSQGPKVTKKPNAGPNQGYRNSRRIDRLELWFHESRDP
jgi:hypothetical protein